MQNSKRKFQRIIFITLFCTAITITAVSVYARPIPVANHSFETPMIDPAKNPFYAIGFVSLWREKDRDLAGYSLGTFHNKPADSNDYISNLDGDQAAFLDGGIRSSLEQELPAVYRVGRQYRMTISACPSFLYPPLTQDSLLLAFSYLSLSEMTDISTTSASASELQVNQMVDFSITLPVVKPTDPYVGQSIGIAIRTNGTALRYWDVDNVRVTELAGDITGEGRVNLEDFAILADQWQSCDNPSADLTGDGCVHLDDVLLMSEYWLDYEPDTAYGPGE